MKKRKDFIQMRAIADKSLCTTQQYNHQFLRKKTTRCLENTIYDYINLYKTWVSTIVLHICKHKIIFLSFILYMYVLAIMVKAIAKRLNFVGISAKY